MAQKSWEEGEKGEGGGNLGRREKKKRLNFKEEGEIGSESREKGDLPPCSTPLFGSVALSSCRRVMAFRLENFVRLCESRRPYTRWDSRS